jgi:hypothetical protein
MCYNIPTNNLVLHTSSQEVLHWHVLYCNHYLNYDYWQTENIDLASVILY